AVTQWRPLAEFQAEDAPPPVAHLLWVLKRQRWKILAFIFACALATLIVSSRVTPVYEATAVIGEDSARAAGNDSDQFLATQIRLIQADSVLRPVAQKYKLLERERQF